MSAAPPRIAPAVSAPPPRRLSAWTTGTYGLGSIAYGVKDAGFGTFLLLYYNQVIGLKPSTVGLVIMCALVIDAVIDPLVGFLSDRTRGKWGRRHPWMYASALPIAIGWIALWNPPAAASQGMTLLWLFATAIVVRSAVSAYEVPSQALTPELSSDYDERTRVTAWRYLFGWLGGLMILLLAYRVFLSPRPGYPNGLLRADGYHQMAWTSAAIMVAAILVSALGTHREIGRLPKPKIAKGTLGDHFRELAETMRNRGFLILTLAGICAYTNQGIAYALTNYLYTYVWQFQGWVFAVLPFALMAGVVLAFFIGPRVARRIGKPKAATRFVIGGVILHLSPYALRFAGVLPAPGDQRVVWVLVPIIISATACGVSGFITGASMMADVVEESEAKTGRRSEGVFFAGSFFVQKCTSGIGIFLAGAILALAKFPELAKPGQVPVATLDRLTIVYMVIYATLAAIAAFTFARFPFGRSEHEARIGMASEDGVLAEVPAVPDERTTHA